MRALASPVLCLWHTTHAVRVHVLYIYAVPVTHHCVNVVDRFDRPRTFPLTRGLCCCTHAVRALASPVLCLSLTSHAVRALVSLCCTRGTPHFVNPVLIVPHMTLMFNLVGTIVSVPIEHTTL